jgi:hypothetical protein
LPLYWGIQWRQFACLLALLPSLLSNFWSSITESCIKISIFTSQLLIEWASSRGRWCGRWSRFCCHFNRLGCCVEIRDSVLGFAQSYPSKNFDCVWRELLLEAGYHFSGCYRIWWIDWGCYWTWYGLLSSTVWAIWKDWCRLILFFGVCEWCSDLGLCHGSSGGNWRQRNCSSWNTEG